MGELRLEAREFQSLARWRWVLTGTAGELLADHEVRLDPGCWQFAAFTDLLGYLSWHAAPDRRVEDEAGIVAEVGEWIGGQVLGPVAEALRRARPATVRVAVEPGAPGEARALLFRPLELGHARGRPLAVQDVTLVMQPGSDEDPGQTGPVGERLRVLGLFSLPAGGQPLNLRRERHAMVRLLRGIGAVGRAVDVRVLQYGVTRGRLREVLEEGEGWDAIHISGHGAPGELLLETEDGSPDPVTAADLADMLDLARERLKLVTVSACWSAALTAAEQRRLLGLPVPDGLRGADGESAGPVGALAVELTDRLGCAVLAMRYPVVDEFAIGLAGRLYELLAARERPLPRALGMALREVIADPPTAACPALSAATPALFGSVAAGLTLAAPRRTQPRSYDAGQLKMARFPAQPDRFVGRTVVMARASAALAAASGLSGVLLHGMPGGGKTACALELAYTHEHAFEALVWYKAPDEGADIRGALAEFALALEQQLPGLQMVHLLESPERLAAFLPALTELMETARLLVVVDNVESLLSEPGRWRDDRWGRMIGALTGHAGLGRLVLTSRRPPAGLDARVRVLPVDALSLDEALLLIRELPHLNGLIGGELAGVDRDAARALAVGVLDVAQGHPKLLELAEGQAADPDRLAALVEAGGQAWREAGGLPEGFFATGESQAAGQDYLHVLGAWTGAATAGLASGERDLFWFLCCLEEDDRLGSVVADNWADLWTRLGRAGDPPGLDTALATVIAAGLVAVQAGSGGGSHWYGIHPGVAASGRADAGDSFQKAVDSRLAAFWAVVSDYAREREGEEQVSGMVVRAGLSATPYLMRMQEWQLASQLIFRALRRDRSPAVAGAVLPALRAITVATAGTEDEPGMIRLLGITLEIIEPAAAEAQLRAALAAALDRGNYEIASVTCSDLARYCCNTGRLAEALTLADQMIRHAEQAGLGPWSQLGDQAERLHVLSLMGRFSEVLAEVDRLRARMSTLPATSAQTETVTPWSVRENLLDTGRSAALQLGRWQDALDLNAEIVASKRDRGAPANETVGTRFNDYGPLLRLDRTDEALALLVQCREVFESARNIIGLANVFSALADVEDKLGHGQAAITLEKDGLRYSYIAGDVIGIAVSHYNFGNYLARHTGQGDAALAHHLAAALIQAITGSRSAMDPVGAAANDIRSVNQDSVVPADVTQLCQGVGEVPGVDLSRVIGALTGAEAAEQALRDLTARVTELATAPAAPPHPYLAAWDPVIAALLAARDGNGEAADALSTELVGCEASDWAALGAVLRRIHAGDTSPGVLTGLDRIDTAVAGRALDALAGRVSVPAALWPAIPVRWLLGGMVAAARGDATAAQPARQGLDELAADHAALAEALGRLLDGDRDPGLATGLTHPTEGAIVATVLRHVTD
jgi:tetratricopeptide (TPR) repeat protein